MIKSFLYSFTPCSQGREPSFPGIIYAVLVGMVIALTLFVSTSHGQEPDLQRAALVHVGGEDHGSGVCISPDGYILTAAHCVVDEKPSEGGWRGRGEPIITIPKAVKVRFPNQETRTARVVTVWRADRKTDLALLKVDVRGGMPYLPYAKKSPGVGEAVTSIGYPAGHFARFESDVTFVGVSKTTFGPMDLIQTSHRGNPGHSGGPLLNGRGEVCGICSMGSVDYIENGKIKNSPQVSLWARCECFDLILKEAGETPTNLLTSKASVSRPVVQVWVSAGCKPCHDALNDCQSLKINYQGQRIDLFLDIDVHSVDTEVGAANKLGITTLPTFIIESTGERIEGYPGPEALNAKIVQILTAPVVSPDPMGAGATIQPEPRLPNYGAVPRFKTSQDALAGEMPAPEKVDATGVRVILLVKKQDLGMLKGTVVSVVEKFAESSLKRKINTALGGKADIDLVFERTKPKRYVELLDVTGIEMKRNAAVVVLVPKQFNGAVGAIAKIVEEKLKALADGDWKYSTILTLAERVDPDGYQAAIDASELGETSNTLPADDQSWIAYIMTAIASTLAGLRDAFLGHKVKKAAS